MSEASRLHVPVLPEETLAALNPVSGGRYLDGTLGMGGHARAVLEVSGTRLCGLDRDEGALELAAAELAEFGDRARLFHLPFASFPEALNALAWKTVDGASLDLGLSSYQLDNMARGFSFKSSEALDMRMDVSSGHKSARDIVNRECFENLKNCFATLGEEPRAGAIARAIIEARAKKPFETAAELAETVWRAYPPAWRRSARNHPATRVFQALRIAVNDELGQLRSFLEQILNYLAPGARLVVISFHSLEDRIVKLAMRDWASRTPPAARALYKKPLVASRAEATSNPRSGSAKLRVAEKLPA